MEVAAILTKLLPIRIVDSISLKFSDIFKATLATGSLDSAFFLNLILLADAKAISDPEKKAENTIQIIIPI